jgi:hypothetical protein
MSSSSTPYGLVPVQKIGFQNFTGAFREYPVKANNSAAIFNGDLVVLSTAGLPSAVGTTPTAIKIPATAADATAGIMGVCVGSRFIDANSSQLTFRNFLPAGQITAGASEVFVRVHDDPDTIFRIKGSAALGTFNSGTNGSGFAGAVGMNAAIAFAGGSTSTGLSGVNLIVGSNGGSLAATSTLALRIIEVVPGTESDAYPEFFVKLNVGVHSYQNSLGLA